ncbi:MAG: hypothetical protein KIT84_15190 [Labilithrix sp.]|nr:hypothetical protein [Labilithrix sp.]MCW5812369.1 hypothetical protein [Labilithrix sp.]
MAKTYRLTRALVLFALAAVLAAGIFIVRSVVRHAMEPCKGTLVEVPLGELTDPAHAEREVEVGSNLEIEAELRTSRGGPSVYEQVRVVWRRPDAACSCTTIPLPGGAKTFELRRDRETGAFIAVDYVGRPTVAFRKTETSGSVFRPKRLLEPNNVGALVFLVAIGALSLAVSKVLLARPYATRLRNWQSATLRNDGLVESPTGASLGRIGPRIYIAAGDVIVEPAVYEGRDVYREMPLFARKDIAAGHHDRWTNGTLHRMRDARTLAILATATTGIAVLAHIISA